MSEKKETELLIGNEWKSPQKTGNTSSEGSYRISVDSKKNFSIFKNFSQTVQEYLNSKEQQKERSKFAYLKEYLWNKIESKQLRDLFELKLYYKCLFIGLILSKAVDLAVLVYMYQLYKSTIQQSLSVWGYYFLCSSFIVVDIGFFFLEILIIFTKFKLFLPFLKFVSSSKMYYFVLSLIIIVTVRQFVYLEGSSTSLGASYSALIVVVGFVFQPTQEQVIYLNLLLIVFSLSSNIFLIFYSTMGFGEIFNTLLQYFFSLVIMNLFGFFNTKSKTKLFLVEEKNIQQSNLIEEKRNFTNRLIKDLLPKRFCQYLKNYLKQGNKTGETSTVSSTENCVVHFEVWEKSICFQIDLVKFSFFCQKYNSEFVLNYLNYYYSFVQELLDSIGFFLVKSEGDSLVFLKNVSQLNKKKCRIACCQTLMLCKEIIKTSEKKFNDSDGCFVRVGLCLDWCFIYLLKSFNGQIIFDCFGESPVQSNLLEQNCKSSELHVCSKIVDLCNEFYKFEINEKSDLDPSLRGYYVKDAINEKVLNECDVSFNDSEYSSNISTKILMYENAWIRKKNLWIRKYLRLEVIREFLSLIFSKKENMKEMIFLLDIENRISFIFVFGTTIVFTFISVLSLFLHDIKYFSMNYIIIWLVIAISFFSKLIFGFCAICFRGKLIYSVNIFLKFGYVFSCLCVFVPFCFFSSKVNDLFATFILVFVIIVNYETLLFSVLCFIMVLFGYILCLNWRLPLDSSFLMNFLPNAGIRTGIFLSMSFIYFGREINFMKMFCGLKKLEKKSKEIIIEQNINKVLVNSVLPSFITNIFLKYYKRRKIFSMKINKGNVCFIKLVHFYEKFLKTNLDPIIIRELLEDFSKVIIKLDIIRKENNVHRIKVSGVNFFAVNLIESSFQKNPNASFEMLNFAFAVKSLLVQSKMDFKLGVSVGCLTVAIIGKKNLRVDSFSTTCNFSSRLCNSSQINSIQICEGFFERVSSKSKEIIFSRNSINLKGFGKCSTFTVCKK